jgi:hypothetical protein
MRELVTIMTGSQTLGEARGEHTSPPRPWDEALASCSDRVSWIHWGKEELIARGCPIGLDVERIHRLNNRLSCRPQADSSLLPLSQLIGLPFTLFSTCFLLEYIVGRACEDWSETRLTIPCPDNSVNKSILGPSMHTVVNGGCEIMMVVIINGRGYGPYSVCRSRGPVFVACSKVNSGSVAQV